MNDYSNHDRLTPDLDHVVASLTTIMALHQVTELRALDATFDFDRRPGIVSGYFDNWSELAANVGRIRSAKGIYFVLNPVNPSLLARAQNRARIVYRDPTTSDRDVTRRRWLPVDLDANRPAGISSSDAEHKAAIALAMEIGRQLCRENWPEPILADSGNGAHLLFLLDLPVDDEGLVKRCLDGLAHRFDTDSVMVDTSVHNESRIWKLYGSVAAKGDDTLERPHRLAQILYRPAELKVVPADLLNALASQAPSSSVPVRQHNIAATRRIGDFDLVAWIAANGLELIGPDDWQGNKKWVFRVCPWDANHTNLSAYLLQFPTGAIAAGCHHESCRDKGWHDLRDVVEPGWRDSRKKLPTLNLPKGTPSAIAREFRRQQQRRRL